MEAYEPDDFGNPDVRLALVTNLVGDLRGMSMTVPPSEVPVDIKWNSWWDTRLLDEQGRILAWAVGTAGIVRYGVHRIGPSEVSRTFSLAPHTGKFG
jgi:hypothetical protein